MENLLNNNDNTENNSHKKAETGSDNVKAETGSNNVKKKKKMIGLQKKLSWFVIGAVLLSIFCVYHIFVVMNLFMLAGIEQIDNYYSGELEKSSFEEIMDLQESDAVKITSIYAQYLKYQIERVAMSVRHASDAVQYMYEHPDEHREKAVMQPGEAVHSPYAYGTVQMLYGPEIDPYDPDIIMHSNWLSEGRDTLLDIYNSVYNLASVYVALEDGTMLQVDDFAEYKVDGDKHQLEFDPRERVWYKQAREITPEEVKEKYYNVTDPYMAYFTKKRCITLSCPIYVDGDHFIGASGVDMYLNESGLDIESVRIGETGYCAVMDEDGNLLIGPVFNENENVQFRKQFVMDEGDAKKNLLDTADAELKAILEDAIQNDSGTGIGMVDGKKSLIAYCKVDFVDWICLGIIPFDEIEEPTNVILSVMEEYSERVGATRELISMITNAVTSVGILIILLIVFLICHRLSKSITKPIKVLTGTISSLEGDNLDFSWQYNTRDEVQILAEAFASMTSKMKKYISDIVSITSEKEKITAELDVATRIQHDMLPTDFDNYNSMGYFEINAHMKPAKEVGGDFYDFFMIDEDHLALVIGDVSGKGVPAAMFMARSMTVIKSQLRSGTSPGMTLANANNQLCEGNDESMFVTVYIGILDLVTGEYVYSNAGHEIPIFMEPGGAFEYRQQEPGFALGAFPGFEYKEASFTMPVGTVFYQYSDGVPEATNAENELFGEERLIEAMNECREKCPEEIIKTVKMRVDEFVGEADQFDDITMLCMKYKGKS